MTANTKSSLATLGQLVALLVVGLGALLAYVRSSYIPTEAYAQAHAAVVAEVAAVRTAAAGTTEQLRGDVREIRAQLDAQGKQLDRIETVLDRLSRQSTPQPPTRRGRR